MLKKLLFLPLIAVALLSSCCNNAPQGAHPEWTYDAVVYEMNVRQYTPEGTYEAAAAHLPRLAELGVDILSIGALTHSVEAFDISMRMK